MWSRERRKTQRKLARLYVLVGVLLAFLLAVLMHSSVLRQGQAIIVERAASEAGLIVELTSGFVRAYSVFGARHPDGKLPNPAIFRAEALKNVEQGIRDGGRFSTGVVGLPGREIRNVAEDEHMRELLDELESTSAVTVSELTVKNGQDTHRSLWAFKATEQACADCHNAIQNRTGADKWEVGDLLGAQVVDQNIDTALANVNKTALVQAVLLFIAVLAIWLCCLYLTNQRRLNRKLKLLATTDPLTGCINRRELYERVNRFKKRTNGAVLMLDLDKFKQINDTHGHDAGDEVIRHFTSSVRASLRATDWIARLGGEEFVVWLPDVTPAEAMSIAERFRIGAEQAIVVSDDHVIKYTVSIGLHIVQNQTPDLFDAWMKSADEHLYRAKQNGRNRVAWDTGQAL